MIELRVLGALRLTASHRPDVQGFTRQAKRAALLTYLAAATPRGPQRRDKILALFWPELDETHARAALNQAVYVLRAALGEDAVVPRGDGAIGLSSDVVWCDAAAFESALDGGRLAEALELYRGDLLDGFFVSDAPEFERWLERERDRLRQRACEGAWALAKKEAAAKEAHAAARWARRASELAAPDDATAQRLMKFLNKLGDRAAAIRAYDAFAERLRREYELEPSGDTQKLAAAIRREVADVPSAAMPDQPSLPAPPVSASTRRPRLMGWLAVSVIGAGVLSAGARMWLGGTVASERQIVRFTLPFSPRQQIATEVGGPTIALAPDGSQLAYVGSGPLGTQLFVRLMDHVEAKAVPNTHGAHLPFFSPDGAWLGFVIGGTIRKVRLSGGQATTVCNVPAGVSGASWASNGIIVFATHTGLWQAPEGGGEARLLARSDSARGTLFRWPEALPGGTAVVFTTVDNAGFHLSAVRLSTEEVVKLGQDGTSPHFVSSGHLLFANTEGALLAAPFDPNAIRIVGPPVPLNESVRVGIAGAAKLGVSQTGTLAYVPEPAPHRSLAAIDQAGNAQVLPFPVQGFDAARVSPDSRQIAAGLTPGGMQSDIWVLDIVRHTSRRVTFDSGSVGPLWAPDGKRIVFSSQPGGRRFGWAIRWIAADGSDPSETLVAAEHGQFPSSFTPDGRALLFQRTDPRTRRDIWILPLEGDRTPRPYLRGPYDEYSASVSPDGKWVAYVSDESGLDEVYISGFPKPGRPIQVSTGSGREPRWSPDGASLFYRSKQGMVVVPMNTAPSLRLGPSRVLFDDSQYLSFTTGAAYDVFPDGRHFLMVRRGSDYAEVVVVLNLFSNVSEKSLAERGTPMTSPVEVCCPLPNDAARHRFARHK